MQLLVLILNKVECLSAILSRFLQSGIPGATVIDSMGRSQFIGNDGVEPPAIFGSFRNMMHLHHHNKTVLIVLDEERVEIARKIINEETGGLDKPGTGILFSIPTGFTEGIIGK